MLRISIYLNINANDTQPWLSDSSLDQVITEDQLQAYSKKKSTYRE